MTRPPIACAPLGLIVAWILALAALSPSADAVLATLLPLLLLASLLAGRYPGERAIRALGRRFAPPSPRSQRGGRRPRPPALIDPPVGVPPARACGARAPPLAA